MEPSQFIVSGSYHRIPYHCLRNYRRHTLATRRFVDLVAKVANRSRSFCSTLARLDPILGQTESSHATSTPYQ